MLYRQKTIPVKVGKVVIGHKNHVVIQSMTNTKTSNISATIKQIKQLVNNGCEIVRVAVLDEADVNSLKQIVKLSPCPIVADIHYNYMYALKAIESGIAKIRINPANISIDNLKQIVIKAKNKKVAIRIGINQGSWKEHKDYRQLVKIAIHHIKQFEEWGFNQIVVSLKTSNPIDTIQLYELAAKTIKYPLHLGVTEAGTRDNAIIKSVIGLAPLLNKGIGDTIRISIAGNPKDEPIVAKKILNQFGLYRNTIEIVSCPTCGRLEWNKDELLKQIEEYTASINKNIKIAIMGCSVNGVGEAKNSDIGVFGTKDKLVVYFNHKLFKIVSQAEGFSTIKKLIISITKK